MMQKLLSLLFGTRYLEPGRVDISIDSMLFFVSFKDIAPMRQLVPTEIRKELSKIGLTGFFPMVLQDCGIKNVTAVPLV
jgi:hypothetical protein